MPKRSFFVWLWAKHILWDNPLVELFFGDVAQFHGGLLEGCALFVSSLGDVGSSVVADMEVESSDQHQGFVEDLVDVCTVGLDSGNAVSVEAVAGISEKSNRMEHVPNDQRLENIEFKVSVASTNSNGDVVTHDLSADHREGLALSGVDLTRHYGGAWLVLWKRDLTEAASWTGSKEPDVVGDFHKGYSDGVEGATEVNERILGRE